MWIHTVIAAAARIATTVPSAAETIGDGMTETTAADGEDRESAGTETGSQVIVSLSGGGPAHPRPRCETGS
jgi:hypothetical protein